ncbi:hypothetical protein BGZ80_002206 [Entomortierella chlamydospora]|uniref:CipC-like antibiotic response protein n=1 Tax=Entomortierella chlamydospora TaxID=101097 RepID=A0A9P6MR25_9FUNG|nr:hypothetical protein BGZ80_002206 [Entomortierella chlamydospora]
MFGFGDSHDKVYGDSAEHHSTWTHELIAGAAAFQAAKMYEKQHPGDKHQLSKELLAGLAGAEADKLFESKGLDFLDREKAKHEAKKRAEQLYDEHIGGSD